MIKRQLELEENAIDTAVQKYQQMKSEVEKIGQGVALRPAQMLLAEWFDPLTEAIREEQLNIKYIILLVVMEIDKIKVQFQKNQFNLTCLF